jgi:copper resistance protein C
MKKYKLFILLLLFGIVGLSLIPIHALSKLHRTDPAPDAVLNQPPSEVFVWFSEPLSTGSNLTILDDQFQRVDKGQTFIDASDATLMRAQVNYLLPGRYTVSWKANPVSGRNVSGSYAFSIESPPLPLLPLALTVGGIILITVVVLVWRSNRRRALSA